MNLKLNQPWIPLDRIETLIQLEPALVLLSLALITWLVYKFLLKELSPQRHENLRTQFINLFAHVAVFSVLFTLYVISQKALAAGELSTRVASYLGLMTLISGSIVFVKTSRLILYEYLFYGHMKEGVPVLIVNLFTLVLSMGIVGWFATEIFGFRLTPLLATSAIFSLVLGLALQDTLGNLFAGVALQLDKPYEIGDWIEVFQNGEKKIGQVYEITWRATIMTGLFDEQLIIPNRVIAQAEIANFSASGLPIWRSQSFRIPHESDITAVRKVIVEATKGAAGVRRSPEPIVNILESTESWLLLRCTYNIDDYGTQWIIGTNVFSAVIEKLKTSGYPMAAQRIQIVKDETA